MGKNRAPLAPRSRALAVVAGAAAASALSLALPGDAAFGAAAPGQPVNDDYGQSDAEVTAEVNAVVSADARVVSARAAVATTHAVLTVRRAAYAKAYAAYVWARKHPRGTRVARAYRALVAARAARARALVAYNAAVARRNAVVAAVTRTVRAAHYRPVDGVYAGDLHQYLVPSVPISFEPLQVQVTVYAGHVSDVAVIVQADAGSDSASYNQMSLTTLMLEAVAADGSASIAAVSGASLTSEAFQQSLQSALIAAGFHA